MRHLIPFIVFHWMNPMQKMSMMTWKIGETCRSFFFISFFFSMLSLCFLFFSQNDLFYRHFYHSLNNEVETFASHILGKIHNKWILFKNLHWNLIGQKRLWEITEIIKIDVFLTKKMSNAEQQKNACRRIEFERERGRTESWIYNKRSLFI